MRILNGEALGTLILAQICVTIHHMIRVCQWVMQGHTLIIITHHVVSYDTKLCQNWCHYFSSKREGSRTLFLLNLYGQIFSIMLPTYHVYCNAFALFTSRPRRLTQKGQALPCLEMQWQCHCQTQLLEFSCQRLRRLTLISSNYIPFTLGNWNFEIVWKIRLSPLKTPNQK